MKCMEICAEFDVKDRRYISAIDFAETQLADAPYFEFTDDEVSSVGDKITVSADRKVYQYFDDVTPVDLSIRYEFKGMHARCIFTIKSDDIYIAESWIIDDLTHYFVTERNYISTLKMTIEAKEVSA